MGAGQSASQGHDVAAVKTSYYELLGVEKHATEDDIKKAYRRKALELHPDRNYGDVERTTSLFAEIQSAYQVLSDPQERAWYDSHEDAILHGGDSTADGGETYEQNVGLTTADHLTSLLGKFNGRIKFTDAPSGFFGYLRETFETLAKEEARAAMQLDLDPIDYPSFGHKDDTHEDVVRTFYAHWAGFSTSKTFSWRDKYSTRDAEDRRMRRLIEKENKRFRDEGIREFNDAVRSFVAFVRKRDPRYTPSTQSEQEREKALREATAAQAARTRAANHARMDAEVLPDWAKKREDDDVEETEEEESEEEHFECVACRKTFKSENQFEAHERSKKHQKSVQALRRKLQKEGVELDLDSDGQASGLDTPAEAKPEAETTTNPQVTETEPEERDNLAERTRHMHLEAESTEKSPEASAATSEADESDIESHTSLTSQDPETIQPALENETDSTKSEANSIHPGRKLGKAAQKRAKKAAQQSQAEASAEQAHRCAVCNAGFPSKTQLFQHIKDFRHAAPASVTKAKGKGGKAR